MNIFLNMINKHSDFQGCTVLAKPTHVFLPALVILVTMAISGESRSDPVYDVYDVIWWWSDDGSTESKNVTGVYNPLTGDFDGDGYEDIFWYGPGMNHDMIWWSNGYREFDEAPEFRVNGVYDAIVGDFDGDGYDDIFWYGPGSVNDYIWWSDGDRTFTSQRKTIYGYYTPFVGDFDGDGNDDIFWYGPGSGNDYIHWSDGDRTFTSQSKTISGSYTPLVGDFDGDGYDDIFWYGLGSGNDRIHWSDGDRTFTSQSEKIPYPFAPFTGNFDGDNGDDIFWYGLGIDADYIWWSEEDRTFTNESGWLYTTHKTLSGDFDGDGDDDIFWYGPGNTECSIPGYDPDFWNDGFDGEIQSNNNCYNYATNKITDTVAQPGLGGSGEKFTEHQCESIMDAAIIDGLTSLPQSGECPPPMATVALAVMQGSARVDGDYHWYRLDNNGMWSHKPAGAEATNLDYSEKPIFNPELADRGPYTDFCGYLCVCSSAKQGEGSVNIKGEDN